MQTHSAAATPVVFLPAWCMVSCGSVTAEVEGGSGPFIYFSLGCRLQSARMLSTAKRAPKLNVQRKYDSRTFSGETLLVCDFRLQLAIILIIYLIRL